MSTKRRLLYLPDEEDLLLGELTDSPRPRPSRLSRLPIISSESGNGNTPAQDCLETPATETIDSSVFVSYNGYTLADGSGTLHPPSTTRDAVALYRSLRRCSRYLCTYIQPHYTSETPTDCSSSLSLSNYSRYSESSDSESYTEPIPRSRKRPKCDPESLRKRGYGQMTVLELRELLRERNLPISGAKALLISRLQESDAALYEMNLNDKSVKTAVEPTDVDIYNEEYSFELESGKENKPSSMWNTLLNIGSKLFRRSTGSHPEDPEGLHSKRRRSA
ncbi:SAP domain [Trypanosoma melophagium]|uniref:SAP domain n=1 Tax=Trypanosoma melophagium TaxID=715481 RepID=UPI00351A0042|nr:SAP domain [Trypanosoma melophagium]